MTHTALTATARRFPQDRGKALSLLDLSFAVGEAMLPPLAVLPGAAAGTVLLGAWLALRLLPRPCPAAESAGASPPAVAARASAGRSPSLWRDLRLLFVMPAVLAPPFVVTGLFFHQVRLAEELNWDLGMVATAFAGFAAARAWAMLRAGPVIDRAGAARLLPLFLLPLAGAMAAILAGSGRPAAAFAYLLAAGLTTGVATTLTTALWAEFYGAGCLGAVRAAVAGAAVVSSALAPAFFGALLDLGVGLRWQAAGCLVFPLGASALTLPPSGNGVPPGRRGSRSPGSVEQAPSIGHCGTQHRWLG